MTDLFTQCTKKGIEIEIVSGGAHGVDEAAIDTAQKIGARWKVIKADWRVKKNAAGPIRNTKVVDYVDCLVAFWDGYSTGTKDAIDKAEARGKLKRVFNEDEREQEDEQEDVQDIIQDEQDEQKNAKPALNCGVKSRVYSHALNKTAVWGCTKSEGHPPPHGHPWARHTW